MKNIIFVTYGGGHAQMLAPVIRRMLNRTDIRCVVLGLTTAAGQLAREGISSVGFRSIIDDGDQKALLHGARLYSELPQGETVSREESIAYLGLSYADLEARLGEERALEEYSVKGRQAFLPLEPMRRVFEKYHPDLLVTTISPRAEQAAIVVAGELGVPSICLVDLFARPSLRRASQLGYGTCVCVISEQVRNWLLMAGRPPDEVVVTGNPIFDRLAPREKSTSESCLRSTMGWIGKKVILWASQVEPAVNPFSLRQGDPALPEHIESHLESLLEGHPDWVLVCRRHPNQEKYERRAHPRAIDGSSLVLDQLLNAVDVVVIMTSTVGLEARLLGKPVVSVDLSVFTDDTPFQDAGLSRGVKSLAELESAIIDGLSSVAGYPQGFPLLGGATDAVVKQIDRLLPHVSR